MRVLSLALAAAAIAYGISPGASARSMKIDPTPIALQQMRMPVQGATDAPIGHVRFCYRHPEECRGGGQPETEVLLTSKRWAELTSVNRRINRLISPVSDDVQYGTIEHWTYPASGKGDCEDYVLLKKKKLIKMGWPAGALLITVVRDENDEGHAVLTVRTNRGELILDNKHSDILGWRTTGYAFIKRQSPVHPQSWESLIPRRDASAVAASGLDAFK